MGRILIVLLFLPGFLFSQESDIIYKSCFRLCLQQDFRKANRQLSKANKKFLWTSNSEFLYLEGIASFSVARVNSKQNEHTIDLFSLYINEMPSAAKGYFRRGLTYLGMFQENLALDDFDKCLALDPGFLPAYYYRAYAKQRKLEPDLISAISDYSLFIALTDTSEGLNRWARFHRGICRQKSNLLGAEEDLRLSQSKIPVATFVYPVQIEEYDTIASFTRAPCYGVKVSDPDNIYEVNSILISDFIQLNRLSSFINVEGVNSYIVTVIPNVFVEEFLPTFIHTEDSFSTEFMQHLQFLENGDKVIFEKILVQDELGTKLRYPSLECIVQLSLCDKEK